MKILFRKDENKGNNTSKSKRNQSLQVTQRRHMTPYAVVTTVMRLITCERKETQVSAQAAQIYRATV